MVQSTEFAMNYMLSLKTILQTYILKI